MSLRTATRLGLVLCAGVVVWALASGGGIDGRHGGWRQVAMAALIVLVFAPAAAILLLRWVVPPMSAMMMHTRRQLVRDGKAGQIEFRWQPLERIAREMWLAAIAAEDVYFRDHSGFDWESIRDARAHNQAHEDTRGASTITQQVAKNLFLWPARSYARKAVEAYLTVLIEALWPKRRILEMYLNIAQWGPDFFGIDAAAHRYFDKRPGDLTAADAALLAAVLPNPVLYRADAVSHRLRFRQARVLEAMRMCTDFYLERL